MKQKPNRTTRRVSSHSSRKTGIGRRQSRLNRNNQDREVNEVTMEIASSISVRYIGISGGLINPIEKGLEFQRRILSLPTYRSVELMVSSTENLPLIHYSRLEYKNAWKVALMNYEKIEI
jgi:hypothetical protein